MRLLLVEDDDSLAKALRRGLVAKGFAVDHADSAELAAVLVSENPYDLVVLDLALPGADGLSFLDALRARRSAVPVLILTARGSVEDRVKGLDRGADDYLRKPFAFSELVARIRALLRRGESLAPAILRVGDVELDTRRFEVRRAGALVTLTAKEFAILEYLLRHAGELVTRSMLLEHCWDESYEGLSNLVDVHVSRLRRKLESAGAVAPLRSIRGAGYVFGETPR
jgi:two-component system, OmpR family, copper resistance phosphate regulon response regulator CusR